jgi:sporulation protein YlmC with PRC-barrel domain
MLSHSLLLSVVIVMLEIVSARAKPCYQEVLDRGAKLPALIVIPAGSPAKEALARALNCSLPPPPTFARGMEVNPKEVVGHPVFTEGGKHLGYVAGVAVDPETWRMKSVVLTSDRTGTTNSAVPFDVLALDAKTASIVTEGSNEEDLGKKWPLESHIKFLDNKFLAAFGFCPMCAYPSVVPINITSDPTGGTIFVTEQPQGITELHAIIAVTNEPTIRIEYPNRKSCTFANGTFTPPQANGGYATFFCKVTP